MEIKGTIIRLYNLPFPQKWVADGANASCSMKGLAGLQIHSSLYAKFKNLKTILCLELPNNLGELQLHRFLELDIHSFFFFGAGALPNRANIW